MSVGGGSGGAAAPGLAESPEAGGAVTGAGGSVATGGAPAGMVAGAAAASDAPVAGPAAAVLGAGAPGEPVAIRSEPIGSGVTLPSPMRHLRPTPRAGNEAPGVL
jgi:hypothetical protein